MSLSWVPLESNPDVMSSFLHELGLSSEYKLVDVYGFSQELIDMLPQPVYALILLYPLSKVSIDNAADKQSQGDQVDNSNVYFMKQTIQNACGTIALLHSVGNVIDRVSIKEDSPLDKFYKTTANLPPNERGLAVEKSRDIAEVHEHEAHSGQTEAPDAVANIDNHFVAFVEKNGRLYELDGRRSGPVDHGPSSPDTFSKDVAALCQRIVAQTDEPVFSAVALVKD